MAETDKLNIDSIIARLLEGKSLISGPVYHLVYKFRIVFAFISRYRPYFSHLFSFYFKTSCLAGQLHIKINCIRNVSVILRTLCSRNQTCDFRFETKDKNRRIQSQPPSIVTRAVRYIFYVAKKNRRLQLNLFYGMYSTSMGLLYDVKFHFCTNIWHFDPEKTSFDILCHSFKLSNLEFKKVAHCHLAVLDDRHWQFCANSGPRPLQRVSDLIILGLRYFTLFNAMCSEAKLQYFCSVQPFGASGCNRQIAQTNCPILG